MSVWSRVFGRSEKVSVEITVRELSVPDLSPSAREDAEADAQHTAELIARKAAKPKTEWEEQEAKNKVLIDAALADEKMKYATRAFEWDTKFQTDHATDVAGYVFQCLRFGDYLSVQIARMGQTFVGGINIAKSKAIQFIEGRVPDRNGVLDYVLYWPRNHYDGAKRVGTPSVNATSWAGWSTDFQMFVPYEKSDRGQGHSSYEEELPAKTERYPRPAKNDEISFEGVGRLLIPAGMGRYVYDHILATLAKDTAPATVIEPPVASANVEVPPNSAC